MRILVSILAALALASCNGPKASVASRAAPFPLEAKLGRMITVEGVPEDAKLGAILMINGSRTVWIDGLEAWPAELRGKIVEVTGTVIQRADLLVFIHQDGEPERAGIPVGPGTDLNQARRRFLLSGARWKVAE